MCMYLVLIQTQKSFAQVFEKYSLYPVLQQELWLVACSSYTDDDIILVIL